MNRKKLIAILATITILTTLFAPTLFRSTVQAADPTAWYHTVRGVLDTDYYTLYPYSNDSLDIGFSKYGEMIDPNTGTGLNYSGRDPFANEGIDINRWINGWFIDISYKHRWLEETDRKIWAMALFADGYGYGGDWVNNCSAPTASPHGGRKTSAKAVTDPLEVLYDGPRKFIAMCTTHIYDVEEDTEWPIVDVILTIIFNKVKKEVIVLKDVKLTINSKDLTGKVDVEFSNRGEWDLGPSPSWASYAHFYHQYLPTCYGGNWTMHESILRKQKDIETAPVGGFPSDMYWLNCTQRTGLPVAEGSEKVYYTPYEGTTELLERGPDKDYTLDYDTGWITFNFPTAEDDELVVEYKNIMKYLNFPKNMTNEPIAVEYNATADGYDQILGTGTIGDETPVSHYYDVAQMISEDGEVVGYAAFWPTTSDYTVDGWADWYKTLRRTPTWFSQELDMSSEPDIPFIIGEWDFILSWSPDIPQFRGVTVYGITDRYDADDADASDETWSDGINYIDREVWYQLSEVFLPWDLASTTNPLIKEHKRVVEFFNGTGDQTDFALAYEPLGWDYPYWDVYCTFAERVLVNGSLQVPTRVIPPREETTYTYNLTHWGGTTWGLNFTEAPPEGTHNIKVLYSVPDGMDSPRYEWIVVGRDAHTVDSIGAALAAAAFKNKGFEIGNTGMDMIYEEYGVQSVPNVMRLFGTSPGTKADYKDNGSTPGDRTALRDDWCTYWPVASSNIISVGGLGANVLSLYLNDFTDAIYGAPVYTPYDDWSGAVCAVTCWDKNAYYSSEDTGYAVIGTYKDINGTVVLAVWGVWGRDTFYASQWLHGNEDRGIEPGIHTLQDLNPHVTSIILEIDYEDPEHPTFEIVEELGTISEKPQHDCP